MTQRQSLFLHGSLPGGNVPAVPKGQSTGASVTAGRDGAFAIVPQGEPITLVAVHEKGIGEADERQLQSAGLTPTLVYRTGRSL